MKNRQSLVKWIREWRIPHQMLEGALSEVRKIRKDSENPVSLDMPMLAEEVDATQLESVGELGVADVLCVPLSSPEPAGATQMDTASSVPEALGSEELINPEPSAHPALETPPRCKRSLTEDQLFTPPATARLRRTEGSASASPEFPTPPSTEIREVTSGDDQSPAMDPYMEVTAPEVLAIYHLFLCLDYPPTKADRTAADDRRITLTAEKGHRYSVHDYVSGPLRIPQPAEKPHDRDVPTWQEYLQHNHLALTPESLMMEPLVQPEGDDWHYSLPVGTYWPLQWFVRKEITKALAKPKKSLRSRDCWAALRSDLNSWLGRGLPGLGFALQEVATNLLQQLNLLDHPVSDGRVQSLGIVHLLRTETLVKVGSSSLSTSDDPDYCGLRNRPKGGHLAVVLALVDCEHFTSVNVVVVVVVVVVADLRSKASAKAKAERGRESSRSGSQPRSSSRKTRRGGNLYEFTDGQLRTALNVCGVQGTADWHKRDLVRKLQSMGIRVKDVQALIDEMNPSGKRHRRQNSRSRGKRRPPMSRAERDFFADDARVVNEFLREEYDDWDDEDEDDYFDFTMDDEPWDSVPWDSEFDDYFADAHEETQYGNFRRGSKGPAENYSYSAPGPDPWNSPGGWTYTSASGYTGSYYSARSQSTGSTWPKSPKVTPEEAMSRALREGWKAEGMSRTQACMLLGLSGQPMPTEVQKVRRQMALRWHPDKNPDNAEAHMAFQLVMAAAEKLNA
ncbi:DNAJB8 [Symbiodinium sp. KB8]|nr:DNAJB8 [Symbiodinium sp. KB8]